MEKQTEFKSNKPLTFWQRLKVAKQYRLKTEEFLKTHNVSFLKELCGVTSKLKHISTLHKMIGYFHYEAGVNLLQISNDFELPERLVRKINEDLLIAVEVKPKKTKSILFPVSL